MSEEIDKAKVIGKRIVNVASSEASAMLTLDDGSRLYITAEGGMGHNEGLASMRYEVYEKPEETEFMGITVKCSCDKGPQSDCILHGHNT